VRLFYQKSIYLSIYPPPPDEAATNRLFVRSRGGPVAAG
jgi:hypothetical protein